MRYTSMVFAAGAAVMAGLSAPSAQAGYVVDLTQEGNNVVATGSGAIDLTGLSLFVPEINMSPQMFPGAGEIITGLTASSSFYTGPIDGPSTFGSGGFASANSGSGDLVGMGDLHAFLIVPAGYSSGSALSGAATYDGQTFSSLGVTPGAYKWTWGSGPNQNFTLDVVPEPSTWAMMLIGFGGLGFLGYRETRGAKPQAA